MYLLDYFIKREIIKSIFEWFLMGYHVLSLTWQPLE